MDSAQENLKKKFLNHRLECVQMVQDFTKKRNNPDYTISQKEQTIYNQNLMNCQNESNELRNEYQRKYGIDLAYTSLNGTTIPEKSTNAVGGSNYKDKYLKYKNKYLNLKNRNY